VHELTNIDLLETLSEAEEQARNASLNLAILMNATAEVNGEFAEFNKNYTMLGSRVPMWPKLAELLDTYEKVNENLKQQQEHRK
jgi:uncharacterized protein YfbU (UPF0304 family)